MQFLNELDEQRINKHFTIDQEDIEYVRCYIRMVVHQVHYKDGHQMGPEHYLQTCRLTELFFQVLVHFRESCAQYFLKKRQMLCYLDHLWLVHFSPVQSLANMNKCEKGINLIIDKFAFNDSVNIITWNIIKLL
jgi:hypothetical protein